MCLMFMDYLRNSAQLSKRKKHWLEYKASACNFALTI